jgi:SAM-dependent methyltransferase
MELVFRARDASSLRMLHVSPEPFFRSRFAALFGAYETADLEMTDVDHQVDLCELPFANGSYDCVYASHVLEHIKEDSRALSEIRRILRPNGIAILPVPIVGPATVEYHGPNLREFGHVRAPGPDYFDKYMQYFSRVRRYCSEDVPARYQPFIYEDRGCYPSDTCPLRVPMTGEKHSDVVPVCYV